MEGIFAINKPLGITSNKALQIIRRQIGPAKVGHAGTLDPLAEGVLVIGIGRAATKQLDTIVQKDKEYLAEVTFGITSSTDDEEGEKTEVAVKNAPTREEVEEVLKKFIGEITQVPPIYSAIKIAGQEAYKRARRGEDIAMKGRPARIDEIEIIDYTWPKLEIRVTTGKGVYIRALARDIGEELRVGGYLSALKRTRVGDFYIEDAIAPEALLEQMES